MHNAFEDEEKLNIFLRQNRVLNVHREFVQDQQNPHWCLLVEYLNPANSPSGTTGKTTGKNRIDYKELLSPGDFAVFAELRDWRKQQAEESGVPVYAIFTNQQLAEMVTLRIVSKTGLRDIEGVGESRVKKYADAILPVLQQTLGQKSENEKGG